METNEAVKEYIESNKKHSFFEKRELTNVEQLSGGNANFVFRIEFNNHETMVLKYYANFLKTDRTLEITQNRYFIEKRTLTLLQDQPWLKLDPSSRIRTPKVLYADDANFVFIMEDAGKIKNLFEHLKNGENLINDESFLARLAKDIKEFSTYLSDHSGITFETHNHLLENTTTTENVVGYVSIYGERQAKALNLEKELAPYLKDLEKAFLPFKYPELVEKSGLKKVFVFGDLWPCSILIDRERDLVWIVDWEMARFETRIRDLEQLMANFWVMRQNEALFSATSLDRLIARLQLEFFGNEANDWRKSSGPYGKVSFVLWVTALVKEKHWELKDQRETVLEAIKQIENI